jgi:hypothetical protein
LVKFTLDDGEPLSLPDENLRGIYDALWRRSGEPNALAPAYGRKRVVCSSTSTGSRT